MAFQIVYSPEVVDHLQHLARIDQVTVLDQVDQQLLHEPDKPTRRRKFLRPNAIAAWELRLGDIRVFYDIEQPSPDPDPNAVPKPARVIIKAVGKKVHNELHIGGQKVEL